MNEEQKIETQAVSENDINPADPVSEDEMDDMETFFGDELDESDEFSGGELDEFSGGELDEISDTEETISSVSNELPNEASRDVSEGSPSQPIKNHDKKKWGMALIALILGNLLVAVIFFIRFQHPSIEVRNTPIIIHQTIPPAKPVVFDSFVISLNDNDMFSYVSISMTFRVRKDIVYREMVEKECLLRGIIYDVLTREINRTSNVPPLGSLKVIIVKNINKRLSAGAIHGVYVDQYLAV